MTAVVFLTLVVVIGGTTVVRMVAPRRAGLEVRSVTGENFAIVLAGLEVVQLLATTSKIGVRVHLSELAFWPLCVLGLALAVAASVSRLFVVLVSVLGILAGVVDTATDDGVQQAVIVLLLCATMLTIMMLARAVLPSRR